MEIKKLIYLSIIFILFNTIVYNMTQQNGDERIQLALNANLNTLQTNYDILLETQRVTASTVYQATIGSKEVIEILSKAQKANNKERDVLREKLKELLAPRYHRVKQKGVLQYHFIFPDNIVFLRMHKPSKFGDDLTEARDDFRYVNETQKPIRVFTQGRTAHGFRNTFPIFDKDGKHIGAVEISFSSDSFQWFLNNISNIHTHFLVDKHIFDIKTWGRDDLILKYSQSAENSDYMVTLGDIHTKKRCITENIIKLKPIREELDYKMSKGDKFSTFIKHSHHIDILSFLPIKNLKEKTVAWLVSYEQSEFIELTLKNMLIMRVVTLIFTTILFYFIILQIRSKDLIVKLLKETNELAYTDTLTKANNRNKFDEVFTNELHRVSRYNYKLSVAIIDIDHFKDFNDTHGHLIGDEVLAMVAQTISNNIRESDTFARWGGEEFMILFPHTDIQNAKKISLKLKDKIQLSKHQIAGNVTVSFGVTGYINGDTTDSIFRRCDQALYSAKERGRNRVEIM